MTKSRKADYLYVGLHIAVLDDLVYGDYDRRRVPKGIPIGSVAGAKISFRTLRSTNRRRTSGQRSVDVFNATMILGPIGLLAGLSRKEDRGLFTISFTNGYVLERVRIGPLLRHALTDARRFQDRTRTRGVVS